MGSPDLKGQQMNAACMETWHGLAIHLKVTFDFLQPKGIMASLRFKGKIAKTDLKGKKIVYISQVFYKRRREKKC